MAGKLTVEKDGDKYAVVDGDGKIVETGFATKKEATAAVRKFRADVGDPDAVADDEMGAIADESDESDEELDASDPDNYATEEEQTPDNPHGLSAHERIQRLIVTLRKRGITHVEGEHATHQNPQTTPEHFARRPATGMNALPDTEPDELESITVGDEESPVGEQHA